jgi:hypothetical protein
MALDGTGTTITFGTTSFTANLLSIDGPGAERGTINMSKMSSTTSEDFAPKGLYDGGELEMTIEHTGAQTPPIDQVAETITITWAGGQTTVFSGFCTGYKPKAQIGERMEATLKIKVTGTVTF